MPKSCTRPMAHTENMCSHGIVPNPDAVSVDDDLQSAYEAYQQDLGQAWQKQVDTLSQWKFIDMDAQTNFYEREIAPVLKSGRKSP